MKKGHRKWGQHVILYKKSYFKSKNNISLTIIDYILLKQRFSLYKITCYLHFSPHSNTQKS